MATIAFIGGKLSHSVLPLVYRYIGEELGFAVDTKSIVVKQNVSPKALLKLKSDYFAGYCITVPYKIQAIPFCNELTSRAQMAGSVNVMKLTKDGVCGDNTDGIGFLTDAMANNKIDFNNKNVLVLGAGGVVRGILGYILESKPKNLSVCNRSIEKVQDLKNDFKTFDFETLDYSQLEKRSYDIIVNGTSASIYQTLPPLPASLITPQTTCLECAYQFSKLTLFQRWALENGAPQAINGLGMLVEQAIASVQFWFGITMSSEQVLKKLANYERSLSSNV